MNIFVCEEHKHWHKNMKYNLIFAILLLLLIGCDFYDSLLIINNRSSKNIYVIVIRDTILTLDENNTFIMPTKYVKIAEKKNLIIPEKNGWERLAVNSINNKLHIFFLSEDTLNKYNPQTIVEKQLFIKRIDVGIHELRSDNWQVLFK